MPYCNYGVVDDFNRTDGDLSTQDAQRWGSYNQSSEMQITSNVMEPEVDGNNYWLSGSCFIAAKYGGNVEIGVTLAQGGGQDGWSTDTEWTFKRSTTSYGTGSGYSCRTIGAGWSAPNGNALNVRFYRVDAGVYTTIGATNVYHLPVTGDDWFISALDDTNGTLTFYVNGTSVHSTTDSTYKSDVGYIGVVGNDHVIGGNGRRKKYEDLKLGGTVTEIVRWGDGGTDNTVTGEPWDTPNNGRYPDDSRTTAGSIEDSQSNYLKLTNHRVTNYPAGTTFQGIQVWVEGQASVASRVSISGGDAGVKLVLSGTITGDNKTDTGTWTTSDADRPSGGHGGASDLWGTSPTVSDMNASTTGVVLCVAATAGSVVNALVDNIRLRIYSTLGAAATWPPELFRSRRIILRNQ